MSFIYYNFSHLLNIINNWIDYKHSEQNNGSLVKVPAQFNGSDITPVIQFFVLFLLFFYFLIVRSKNVNTLTSKRQVTSLMGQFRETGCGKYNNCINGFGAHASSSVYRSRRADVQDIPFRMLCCVRFPLFTVHWISISANTRCIYWIYKFIVPLGFASLL